MNGHAVSKQLQKTPIVPAGDNDSIFMFNNSDISRFLLCTPPCKTHIFKRKLKEAHLTSK